MPKNSFRRHIRAATIVHPAVRRWPVAIKAATVMFMTLAGSYLLGYGEFATIVSLGAFVVLYGPNTPGRYRARLSASVALALTVSATVGAVIAPIGWLWVVSLATTAALATFVFIALEIGAPSAFFVVLVQGVAGAAALSGTSPTTIFACVAIGSTIAVIISLSDLLWDRNGPQRRAVQAADQAVREYEMTAERGFVMGDGSERKREWGELRKKRHRASVAIHQAWTAVTDGSDPVPFAGPLREVQARYIAQNSKALTHAIGLACGDAPAQASSAQEHIDIDLNSQDRERRRRAQRVASEQMRETSLGRPSGIRLLVRALRRWSEERLIAKRVFFGTLCAGLVALVLGSDHVYWASAFASLLLNRGGTRDSQIVRVMQRLVGTFVGLGLFALLASLDLSGWPLIVVVVVLQGTVEMIVVKNYAIAVMFITPLALTLAETATKSDELGRLVLDRGVDTVIAVVFVLLSLFLIGRGRRVPMLRRYARTVVQAIEEVLVDIAANRQGTPKGREHRKLLYHALLQSHEVAGYALADEPQLATDYGDMEETLNNLGYLVLSMAWHPDLRDARDLAAQARGPLDSIQCHSVSDDRVAEDIHADVRELENLVRQWRPDMGA